MTIRSHSTRVLLTALALALGLAAAPLFANSTIHIINVNAPGVGFNDPTPAAPVGGNPGTTVGEQRLIAFQYAASVWGTLLDSAVPIQVEAQMVPLACSAAAGTLGTTRALQVFANFPGAPQADTWYHVALANRLAFADLAPGAPGDPNGDDLNTSFNSAIGTAACLPGSAWYYGLDGNHGVGFDLVTVILHELAHGLGFSTFINKTSGQLLGPPFFHDVFERLVFDDPLGLRFDQMTDTQRAASTKDTQHVVWSGPNVTAAVPATLAFGIPALIVHSPAAVAGFYGVGTASFGPPLASPGVTGNLVQVNDGAGGSTTDACEPLVNAAAIAGNVAFLDRGTCTFTVKTKNAQNAGATAVVVADLIPGSPPAGLAGADPTITIPTVRISRADSDRLKAALAAGINVTVGLDQDIRAGADPAGRALLFTPEPVAGGSSLSHWDASATPDLLMEPNINSDLTHDVDLTLPLFRDIGWAPDADLDGVADGLDQCAGSNLAPTVVLGSCDSGVTNTLFTTGCTISDLVAGCAVGAKNHGAFASCVSHLTNDLNKAGILSGSQKGAIQSCT